MLVPMSELLEPTREGHYAVGSFNVYDVELALGVLDAAVEKHSPVILAVGEFTGEPAVTMEEMFQHISLLADDYAIPIAAILDHGRSVSAAVRAIKNGASAVMVDASTLPFEENAATLKQAAEIAHWAGVSCEGEIGHVGQGADYEKIDEDRQKWFTQPDDAVRFVEMTGVDALAVAVGTAHGVYTSTPKLDFDLLARLSERVRVPLVLHGGSGTGDENLSRAAKLGVGKINIGTELGNTARDRLACLLAESQKKVRIGQILATTKGAYKDVAGHYMDVFGSTGKA